LTEEKLSRSRCPGGILEIPIQGLTYSGAIDPRDESVGYVICLRSDKELESVEKCAAAHYHETKLMPFIERQRILLGWEVVTDIPEALASVSWCDGGGPQMEFSLNRITIVIISGCNCFFNVHGRCIGALNT
jgi:hypothetical protein